MAAFGAIPFARSSTYQPSSRLSELVLRRGEQEAEAARASGDIAARALSTVGQSIGSSLGDIARQRQQAPIVAQEAEARTIGLENARAEQAAGRKATENASIMQSAQSSGLDPDAIEAQLKQLGRGDLASVFRKSWTEAETHAATLKTAKLKAADAEADYFGSLAAGVQPFLDQEDGGMGAVKIALQHAKAAGYEDADGLLEQIKSPMQVKALVDGLIAKSPTYSKLAGEAADRTLKQTQEQRALATAQQAQADREADNRRADTAEQRAAAAQAEAVRHNRVIENKPTGATAPVSVLGPDGKPVYVRPDQAIGRTPAAGSQKAASGLEKRALNFFNRARQADIDLEGFEPQIQKLGLVGQTKMAALPNFMQSELGQQYTQAQRAFTEARLRKDSGAAIPEQEFANDRRTYFAQPGDSQETLEQKRRGRAAVLASLGFESGQALGEFVGDANEAKAIVSGYKQRADKAKGGKTIGRFQVEVSD